MNLLGIEHPPVIQYEHSFYDDQPVTMYRLPEPFKLTDELVHIDFTRGRGGAVDDALARNPADMVNPDIRAAELFSAIPDVSAVALNGCEIAVLGGTPDGHARAISAVARETVTFFGRPHFVPFPEDSAPNL